MSVRKRISDLLLKSLETKRGTILLSIIGLVISVVIMFGLIELANKLLYFIIVFFPKFVLG